MPWNRPSDYLTNPIIPKCSASLPTSLHSPAANKPITNVTVRWTPQSVRMIPDDLKAWTQWYY